MKRVLFVCTGNTCRSPMAELIFNKLAREKGIKAFAQSAGLCTIEGLLINDNSHTALKELGIDSDFFRSSDIYDMDLLGFDMIFGMTKEHTDELEMLDVESGKIHMLNEKNGGVADPYGSSLAVYKSCRDEIYNAVEEILNEL